MIATPRLRVQFDHVLAHALGGARIHQATAVRLPVSDHRALAVEVELGAVSAHYRPRVALEC